MPEIMTRTATNRLVHLWAAAGVGLLLGAAPLHAQDEDSTPPPAEATTTDDETEDNATEAEETDDESYLDIEQEDFTPSEEIPTDQSIPFPTDI